MIARLEPKGKNAFLTLLEQDPLFGGRIATALDCWEGKDAVCGFYQIDDTAALLVQGGGALLCGAVAPEQAAELTAFLRFAGAGTLTARTPCLPGRQVQLAELCRPAGWWGMSFAPPIDVTIRPAPSLWALRQAGFFAQGDPDGWYADACARSVRGLAEIWIAEQQGAPVATAGVYSLRDAPFGGYLTAVETLPDWRGRGYALALVDALARKCGEDRPLRLICAPRLLPLYRAAGFEQIGTVWEIQPGE